MVDSVKINIVPSYSAIVIIHSTYYGVMALKIFSDFVVSTNNDFSGVA